MFEECFIALHDHLPFIQVLYFCLFLVAITLLSFERLILLAAISSLQAI